MKIKDETNASAKLGTEKAQELIKGATKVVVMRGKKVTVFDLIKEKPTEAEMLAVMLGTTGNLRAPTVVRGKTVLVGFNADIYGDIFS